MGPTVDATLDLNDDDSCQLMVTWDKKNETALKGFPFLPHQSLDQSSQSVFNQTFLPKITYFQASTFTKTSTTQCQTRQPNYM
jgi:hypothetical protein